MMMVTMMTKAKFSFQCHSSDGFQPDVAQDGSLTRYRIEGFFVKKKLFTQIDTDTDTNRGIFLCEKTFHTDCNTNRGLFLCEKNFSHRLHGNEQCGVKPEYTPCHIEGCKVSHDIIYYSS